MLRHEPHSLCIEYHRQHFADHICGAAVCLFRGNDDETRYLFTNPAGARMIRFSVRGMTLAVDFTAPALLALLSLYLTPPALLQTLSACLLHEAAHLLAAALTGQKPSLLRISAAGMHMELRGSILCPTGTYCVILCAGAAANLLAAAYFSFAGLPSAAQANLSLGLFNLLPFRSTDGGTLLHLLLEHICILKKPELPAVLMRLICCITACLLCCGLCAAGIRNLSVWGMLIFMFCSDMLHEP